MSEHGGSGAGRLGGSVRAGALLLAGLVSAFLLPGARADVTCTDPGPQAPIPDITLQRVAWGFDHPVYATSDGSGRLLVVEQRGVIRGVDPTRKEPGPVFLDIHDRVESGGEKGLLGLAFHPDFGQNGYFYVDYTYEKSGGGLATRISRFTADTGRGSADPASERVILSFPQPFPNDNGGQLAFGPHHYLYVGTGDGGGADDPDNNAQRLDSLLGKILRVDVDNAPAGSEYAIPPDNPFRGTAGARPEVWAYGLRNPWRFSFDPDTGRLYAGDVGQDQRQEIDLVEKGGNYGWRIMEGTACNQRLNPKCEPGDLRPPLLDYDEYQGTSVTGGYAYRGSAIPGLCGVYLYGDYGSGKLWGLRDDGGTVTQRRLLLDTGARIASFGRDAAGEIYVVDYRGALLKVVGAGGS